MAKAKGKIISKEKIIRRKGYLVFVDGEGNVRESPMKRGGTKGRKTCKAASPKKKKAAPKKKAAGTRRKAAPKKKR